MTIATGNILKVTAGFRFDSIGQNQANVFTIRIDDANSQSQSNILDDIAEFLEGFYTPIQDRISDNINYEEINVFNLTTGNPEDVIGWPTLISGTNGSDALPPASAGLVFGRTGYSKRIPKRYLPTFGEDTHGEAGWTALTLVDLADLAGQLATQFIGTNGVSFTHGAFNALLSPTFVPIIEGVVAGVAAYQRRRKAGRGS